MVPLLFINTFYAINFTFLLIIGLNFAYSFKTREIPARDFQAIVASLWKADDDRQALVLNNGKPSRLFPTETLAKFKTKPTVAKLLDIFELYDDEKTVDGLDQKALERLTKEFLNELAQTKVFTTLQNKLKIYDVQDAQTVDGFKSLINDIWFRRYKRKNTGEMGSSAFQHVFIGENKPEKNEVSGLHNWIRYSYLEQNGLIKGGHYIRGHTYEYIATINYEWNGKSKAHGSMFVGTSPEFEMAVFTLCYLFMPGKEKCNFFLSDCTNIRAITMPLENSQFDKNPSLIEGRPLGTAYPAANGVVKNCIFDEEMVPAPPVAKPAWGNGNAAGTLFSG